MYMRGKGSLYCLYYMEFMEILLFLEKFSGCSVQSGVWPDISTHLMKFNPSKVVQTAFFLLLSPLLSCPLSRTVPVRLTLEVRSTIDTVGLITTTYQDRPDLTWPDLSTQPGRCQINIFFKKYNTAGLYIWIQVAARQGNEYARSDDEPRACMQRYIPPTLMSRGARDVRSERRDILVGDGR